MLLAACGKPAPREATKYTASGDNSGTIPTTLGPSGSKGASGKTGASGTTKTETPPTPPKQDGSWQYPFLIGGAFPQTISHDTATSSVSTTASYSCSPAWSENGPEVVYKIVAPANGTLSVSFPEANNDGVELDVFLLNGAAGDKCIAQGNADLVHTLQAGQAYWLVFDSWSDATGQAFPGAFTATVTFTTAASTSNACPSDMIDVPFASGVCMDKFEAPNAQGEKPLVMYNFDEAEAWCAGKGKRLCFDDEWTFACATAAESPYPYGWAYDAATCHANENDVDENATTLSKWPATGVSTPNVGTFEELISLCKAKSSAAAEAAAHVQALYQADAAGGFAGCTNAFGVRDLVGSVEEWTRRRDGGATTAEGKFSGSLKGGSWIKNAARTCQSNVRDKADPLRFHTTGFRCCKNR